MPTQADTLERITQIIRTELKLGDDVTIDERTRLVEGEIDLDSLDILLLVTRIEREFGIKIPNEAVGREAFTDVGSLARFVDERAQS